MKDVTLAVLQVELCMKESIYKYHGNTKLPFLCITVSQHRIVQICKRVLENGFPIEGKDDDNIHDKGQMLLFLIAWTARLH